MVTKFRKFAKRLCALRSFLAASCAGAFLIPAPAAATCGWTITPSTNPSTAGNVLLGVAAVSATDAWAVGSAGVPSQTLIERWNGSRWRVVPSPNYNGLGHDLTGVAAISKRNVWTVGDYYDTSVQNYQTLIEHWNGANWTIVPSPNATAHNSLLSVAGISARDVWAVGYFTDSSFNEGTLIEHWDGSMWTIVPSPNANSYQNRLQGVAAIGAHDVWTVGEYFDIPSSSNKTLIEHWNGSAWSIVPSPNANTNGDLHSVAAISTGDVWAVGAYDDPSLKVLTLAEHWNGTQWTVVPSQNAGNENALLSASADSSANVWAVGDYFGRVAQTLGEQWDGTAWSLVPTPDANNFHNYLFGVAAIAPNDVLGVGYYKIRSNGTYRTLTMLYHC